MPRISLVRTKLTTYNSTGFTVKNVEARNVMDNCRHSTTKIFLGPNEYLRVLITKLSWRSGLRVKLAVREVEWVLSTT
jgi:hypothetical protein